MGKVNKDTWKTDLKPLAEMVAAPYAWLWSDERTDEELAKIGSAALEPTQSNCGWNTYEAAVLVKRELPIVLRHREEAQRKEAEQSA